MPLPIRVFFAEYGSLAHGAFAGVGAVFGSLDLHVIQAFRTMDCYVLLCTA